jgi:hypothetical protein
VTLTPEIPESAVRLTATGTGLEFLVDRHAYLALDAAVRAEVFPGQGGLVERPATADEAGRLADFLEGDTPVRGRLTSAAPDFFGGPAAAGLAFFLRTSGGFSVEVPDLLPVPGPSRN